MKNLNFCSSPYKIVSITSSGDVVPCLCYDWHTQGSIGNINHASLLEIFNNDKIQIFRASILNQKFNYCKSSCAHRWNLDKVDLFPDIVLEKNILPSEILLAIDQNCNLKCTSCRNENIFDSNVNPKAEHILTSLLELYKDHQQPVTIRCDGLGDIFASKAYLDFFNRPDIPACFRFEITTNGNLITKNLDIIQKIKSQLVSVEISFDAATSETYKKIRGGKFDLILDGFKELVSIGIPVATQFVVQYQNYQEILDYKNLVKTLGATHIGFKSITQWGHMSSSWWENNKLNNNQLIDYKFLNSALKEINADHICSLDGYLIELLNT